MDELQRFIEEVHNEPYNLLTNDCKIKHSRIVRKAQELGHDASMMGCISVIPVKVLKGLPLILPHAYAKVDGKTVDVTFDPCLEEVCCPNEDIVKLLSINLSKLSPHVPKEGPPLPRGLNIRWPWRR